jgi:hypothetical protein
LLFPPGAEESDKNRRKTMIATIEHDVIEAFTSLKRAIRRGDQRSGAQMIQNLLSSQDTLEVWKFLLEMASSGVSYTDQNTAVFVRTMYENWTLLPNPVFAVHAVLALSVANKGTSAQDYISRRTD